MKERPAQESNTPSRAKEDVLVAEKPAPKIQEAFDESKLLDVLDGIIHAYKEKDKNMEIAVIRQPFEINGERITFFLNGELQRDIFEKIKPELQGLLQKSLHNSQVMVSFEIKEEAVAPAQKLYTSTDKLMYLREKSPALKELQKRFGLETDF